MILFLPSALPSPSPHQIVSALISRIKCDFPLSCLFEELYLPST
nr:MAG TPA: hypothetical protein [Caudoviricetes sp.]